MNIGIDGLIVRELKKYTDDRGWLVECFRQDEMAENIFPAMAYVSKTHPNVIRGPHEHKEQTDYFCFLGEVPFKLYFWDNRPDSITFNEHVTYITQENTPVTIEVPPGVVHAYKNIGKKMGLVLNFPNKLFAGKGKAEPIDEIRHEKDPNSPFKVG